MSATGRPAGFTLIEMLVVLGIAGLIAGLGFPRLQGQIALQEWRSSVAGAMALLRSARADAIRGGGTTLVSVAPGNRVLRRDGRDNVSLPASVTAAATAPIRFAADGSSNGGTLVITGARRGMVITVAPATGLLQARPA
jgi:general secretion pathway protein H